MENLLLIEDMAGQRELTERLYHMCKKVFHSEVGFLTADSWEAGLKVISAGHVSVVLLDLGLPPMATEDTLRELSKLYTTLPPVLAFTGHDGVQGLREACFEAGCDDFIEKSEFNHRPEDLFKRVYHAFLRRKKAHG